jgi:hypothetical protein
MNEQMQSQQSLEGLLGSSADIVQLFRNQQTGPNVYPGVPAEFTNWRDEQRAWQQTCVLFNQSYHMADLQVEGRDGEGRAKAIEFPSAVYSMHPYDQVLVGGKLAGLSTWIGYSSNEGRMLSLAMMDAEHAEPGTPVSLLWGEAGGGTSKPTVEPHVQTEIRATVSPVPYSEVARDCYADGWRTKRHV